MNCTRLRHWPKITQHLNSSKKQKLYPLIPFTANKNVFVIKTPYRTLNTECTEKQELNPFCTVLVGDQTFCDKQIKSIRRNQVCQVKLGYHINPEALKTFLLSVDNWRVLCFDTESDSKMLYKVKPDKGKKGWIPILFGNPVGQVLVFHDSRETPQELQDCCADFRYVKFQSGAVHDLAHLKGNGFLDFRGVVDIQTLITLTRPATKQCSLA